jgi:hypothetical protein
VITAKSITTSGTGAVTWTAADASKVASVTTDGGADAITVSGTNGNLTVSTGGGNDTVTVGANTTAAKSLTVNLGDGTGDTLKITTGVNLTTATSTFSASGHEILDLQGTLTLPNSLVNGSTAVVTDSAAAVLAATIVMGTDTTTDLSGLVINTSKLTAGADGFVIGNAASTASLTLKATSLGDTLNGGTVADTLTGGSGGDTITALAGNDTIVGGAGADTINAGTGNDHVTAGEGADGVIVGAGADTVVLTETTSAADNVQFAALTDGSAAGVAGKNFSGYNVITGFKTTVDDLVFDGGVANIDDTVDTDILNGSIIVKAGTVATTALNDITADNFTSVDQVVNFLNDAGVGFTATASQNEVFFVTIGTGASAFTAVYAFVNNADTTVDATELYLIATVDATLVAGDGIG